MKKCICFSAVIIMSVFLALPVGAISESQKTVIVDNCDKIKETLTTVQHQDSRTRVYLGRYYETILTNFITPLNLRLVENNISDPKLLDNQTNRPHHT